MVDMGTSQQVSRVYRVRVFTQMSVAFLRSVWASRPFRNSASTAADRLTAAEEAHLERGHALAKEAVARGERMIRSF
jgi:hypothetical protein